MRGAKYTEYASFKRTGDLPNRAGGNPPSPVHPLAENVAARTDPSADEIRNKMNDEIPKNPNGRHPIVDEPKNAYLHPVNDPANLLDR
jgi:hypothetical protein